VSKTSKEIEGFMEGTLAVIKRKLLQFRFWREMSIREIAALTGSSERAVEGKIYRAKKILKVILQRKHPALELEVR